MLAIPAGTTGDERGHYDPIATPDIFYRTANFNYLTHEFMTQNIVFPHTRDQAVNDVQIGAARGGEPDANNGIMRIEQTGIGYGLNT